MLREVVPDKALCEEIYEQSGVDLRNLPKTPDELLRGDEAKKREKLAKIEESLKAQENNISVNPVWGNRNDGAQGDAKKLNISNKPGDAGRSGGTNKSGDADRSGGTNKPGDAGRRGDTVLPGDRNQSNDVNQSGNMGGFDAQKNPVPVSYAVAFDANGGNPVPASQTVRSGNQAAAPTETMLRTGYSFTGWYTDLSCTARYDFGTPVRGSFTLYAGWKIDNTISYQVIFNANGLSNPATQTVKGGSKVSKPSLSPWSGHVFRGWYTDVECTQVYDFATPVISDFTLYAGWKIDNNTYTVTFDPCGAAEAGTRQVKAGESLGNPLTGPALPAGGSPSATKGYTFNGWYTTKQNGGERVTADTIVTGDMTVYARWNEWGYDAATKTLTIDIEGDMPDYSRDRYDDSLLSNAPWYSQRGEVGTIVLEEGITSIGTWAFAGFSKLTNITLPQSVAGIGIDAFYGCSSLQSIVIPEGVTVINGGTFKGCSSLDSITLPQSLRRIEDAKYYWTGPMIGGDDHYDGAFEGCTSLTEIEIPESVTYIGTRAFQDCSKLNSIVIPEGVTSIQQSTFAGCAALAEITLPKSLRTIQSVSKGDFSGAFARCNSLTEMVIPEGVTDIGTFAFAYCASLKSIALPDNITSIAGAAFYECRSLTDVKLPKNLEKIETIYHYDYRGAFGNCSRLTEITIPASVTSIADHAFSGSGLTNVYFDGTEAEKKWSYNFGPNVTIHYKDAEPAAVFVSLDEEEVKQPTVSDNDAEAPDTVSDNDVEAPDTVSDNDVEKSDTVSGDDMENSDTVSGNDGENSGTSSGNETEEQPTVSGGEAVNPTADRGDESLAPSVDAEDEAVTVPEGGGDNEITRPADAEQKVEELSADSVNDGKMMPADKGGGGEKSATGLENEDDGGVYDVK